MKLQEWVKRYAAQIQAMHPEVCNHAAIMLALSGVVKISEAEIETPMMPEEYAMADVKELTQSEVH